jgi:hypothetical protein
VLRSHGLWFWEAEAARSPMASETWPAGGALARIWSYGQRPRVVAWAEDAPLATATVEEYFERLVRPLLLAAILTGRVPALPSLPCDQTPWLTPNNTLPADGVAEWRVWRACRTGFCSYRTVAVGSTSAEELAADEVRAAAFQVRHPFPQAATVARAPLRCVPFAGMMRAALGPLRNGACRSGAAGWLLHPPDWEAYEELLRREGLTRRPFARLTVAAADARMPRGAVGFDAFARSLELHAGAHVLLLSQPLLVEDTPIDVERAYQVYCGAGIDCDAGPACGVYEPPPGVMPS